MLLGMLTCKEALQRLDDYIDRELTAEEMEQVKNHIKLCRACTRKFAAEATFVAEMRSKLDRLTVPADLMEQISRTLTQRSEEGQG